MQLLSTIEKEQKIPQKYYSAKTYQTNLKKNLAQQSQIKCKRGFHKNMIFTEQFWVYDGYEFVLD